MHSHFDRRREEKKKIGKDTMTLLNLCHVILTFAAQNNSSVHIHISKELSSFPDFNPPTSISTFTILDLLIVLCLYISGPLKPTT